MLSDQCNRLDHLGSKRSLDPKQQKLHKCYPMLHHSRMSLRHKPMQHKDQQDQNIRLGHKHLQAHRSHKNHHCKVQLDHSYTLLGHHNRQAEYNHRHHNRQTDQSCMQLDQYILGKCMNRLHTQHMHRSCMQWRQYILKKHQNLNSMHKQDSLKRQ